VIAPDRAQPQLKETAFWRNGRKVASALMGVEEGVLEGWGHMIRKPPKIGEPLPWHQDEAYWDPALIYRALGSWLPLDDATPQNGCMSFIPGSHRREVLAHRHVNDDPAVHALFTEPDPAEIATAELVPVPAGGAVFHHSRTLHSSGPNTTDKVRRAYANEWQLAPVKAETAPVRPWIEEHRVAWAARVLDPQAPSS
jgi:ectoine hydroxylase-related dioxygenase (phytanoyl-CoA dioxygenase family)